MKDSKTERLQPVLPHSIIDREYQSIAIDLRIENPAPAKFIIYPTKKFFDDKLS